MSETATMKGVVCGICGHNISYNDVFKVSRIINNAPFLAVTYSCPQCDTVDKVAMSPDDWNAEKELSNRIAHNLEQQLQAAHIEVEFVDGVDDLIALWRSYPTPPIIEENIGRCGCMQCLRRLYGTPNPERNQE